MRAQAKVQRPKASTPKAQLQAAAVRDRAAEAAAQRHERLQAARAATSDLVGASLSEDRDERWPAYLRDTAATVLATLSTLARDEAFWLELEGAERRLGKASPEHRGAVAEILESDLTGLLELMGYVPPPSVEELGEEMQVAFSDAMSEPDAALRSRLSRDANHRMLIYVYRLRKLIADVDRAQTGSPEGRRLLRRLTAITRVGARVIIPATGVAGAVAMMFPDTPAGVALAGGGALLHLGMSAATKEATKQGLLMASTSLMASMLAAQEAKADPHALLAATEAQLVKSMAEAVAVAEHLLEEGPETVADELKAVVIEAMRWSFQLQQVRCTLNPNRPFDAAERGARAVTDTLKDLRDWIQLAPDYEGLADITARLDLALEHLHAHRAAASHER